MIEKRTLKNGRRVYRVRWREAGRGSREHMRSFDRREDAVRFETEMRRRKQLGELAGFEASKVTLGEFAREWWRRYASTELARSTQERYASMWDLHVLPRLGDLQLRQLTPGVVDEFQSELRAAGAGEPTIRKTLALLQAVCREAVTWGRLTSNPVKPVRKRAVVRQRAVRPLLPAAVERLRRELPTDRDAVLVSMLAYDLRHSFVSLLIAEGRSIVDVARQAGHSATMALDTYGHVFDELDGAGRIVPEEAIREARADPVRTAPARVVSEKNKTPRFAGSL